MEANMTKKIKAVIKAKLIELEAYVDDELPDYIMVMVANKKTQPQMASDLSLFLGEDADRFAAWLQRVLNKIQKISEAKKPVAGKEGSKNSKEEVSKTPTSIKKTDKETTPIVFSLKPRRPTSKEPSPAPATLSKKIAISLKKKIEIKTKSQASDIDASPASSALSPRGDTPSPVSTATPRQNSPPPRTPTPELASDAEDRKRKASRVDASDEEAERKRKRETEPDSRKSERQNDVEEKEKNIILIMEQIKKLKNKLVERAEESASDEDDDDMSDVIRDKITTLRKRLESIQEDLAEEEEEEKENNKEIESETTKEASEISPKPTIKMGNVDTPEGDGLENESLDSRCTTPVLDELPSPQSRATSEDLLVVNMETKTAPTTLVHDDAEALQRLHLPLFLLSAEDHRQCVHCSEVGAAVLCSGCRVVLHCCAEKNCFRSFHVAGSNCDESQRLESIPINIR